MIDLRWLHRTIGVFLGAWLAVFGLTGAITVFYREIDQALHARLMRIEQPPVAADLDAMAAAVRAAHPDRPLLSFERYGLDERESYPFVLGRRTVAGEAAGAEPDLEVFVDPRTQAILGERDYWTALRLIRSFHMELLVPGTGERIVGVAGLLLLVTGIAGIVLWWRESRRRLSRALRPRWNGTMPVVLRDTHTVGGIWFALFIVMQASSGALVADWYQASSLVERWFSGDADRPASAPPRPAQGGAGITASAARDTALRLHPDSQVVMVTFPGAGAPFYSVRLYPRDQAVARHMRQVVVDSQSGAIVRVFDPDSQPLARRIVGSWMIWIHNGVFFGTAFRTLLVPTGLVLALLFPTGLYMWLRTRRSRLARTT